MTDRTTDVRNIASAGFSRRTLMKTGIGAIAAPAVLSVIPANAQSKIIKIALPAPDDHHRRTGQARQADNCRRQGIRGDPQGKLRLNMLGLFSEYERAKIMERMTRGRLYRQEDRDCTGHARHQRGTGGYCPRNL